MAASVCLELVQSADDLPGHHHEADEGHHQGENVSNHSPTNDRECCVSSFMRTNDGFVASQIETFSRAEYGRDASRDTFLDTLVPRANIAPPPTACSPILPRHASLYTLLSTYLI